MPKISLFKTSPKDKIDASLVSKYLGIIFENEDNKIINDNKNLDLFDWCGFYLQRYPPSLINKKFIESINFGKRYILQLFIKRFADITISIFLIIILLPVMIFAGFCIYLEDKGPIFYSQIRTGINGKNFLIYKFRTMKVDSEIGGAKWSSKSDKRINKIGNILRELRIDELPQLWNVIKGDMSLIGPRPERPEFDSSLKKEINFYSKRYIVKPGISGWAQVNYPYGSSFKDSENKFSFDLFYIKHFSILLDLLILIKTIKTVFTRKVFNFNY